MSSVKTAIVDPDGWVRGDRLTGGTGRFGEVFEVREAGTPEGERAVHVLRLLPFDPDHADREWVAKLLQRSRQLMAPPLPHVIGPLQAGELGDGTVYLVEPRLDCALSSQLQTSDPLPPAEARHILEQVLAGLAALHARGIAHGDLRPGNILLSGSGDRRTAWIGDAALGPLPWWSHGARLGESARHYYPPEWKQQTHEPDFRSDLYALGVLACQMFLGRDAPLDLERSPSSRPPLQSALKRSGAAWPVRRLIHALLAPQAARPADATILLRQYRRWERNESRFPFLCAVVALAVVALILILWYRGQAASLREQLTTAQQERDHFKKENTQLTGIETQQNREIARLKASTEELTQERDRLKEERDRLKKELAAGRGGPPPPPPPAAPSSEELARTKWQEVVRTTKTIPDRLRSVQKTYEESTPDVQAVLGPWHKRLERDLADSQRWWPHDRTLLELLQRVALRPWDAAAEKDLRDRLGALNLAGEKWHEWAYNPEMERDDIEDYNPHGHGGDHGHAYKPEMEWEDIEKLIESDPEFNLYGGQPREILNGWRSRIIEGKSKGWTVQLVSGSSKKTNWGTGRLVSIGSDDEKIGWTDSVAHSWAKPTAHTYPRTKASQLHIKWEPDKPLGVKLRGEEGYVWGRYEMITKTDQFRGPLALWRMHNAGMVEQDGFVLKFEVLDCPGPPRGLFSSVVKSLAGSQK